MRFTVRCAELGIEAEVDEDTAQDAAEQWIRQHEQAVCEYPVAGGKETREVEVVGRYGTRHFSIEGEPVPHYVVRQLAPAKARRIIKV